MLMPKRTKHRKHHRGRRRGLTKGHDQIAFGEYGLTALEPAAITNRQLPAPSGDQEAGRDPHGFR